MGVCGAVGVEAEVRVAGALGCDLTPVTGWSH